MNTFTINTNSWHYWLACKFAGMREYNLPYNICFYSRKVLRGILTFTTLSAAAIFLTTGLGTSAFFFIQEWFFHGSNITNDFLKLLIMFGIITWLSIATATVVISIVFFIEYLKEKHHVRRIELSKQGIYPNQKPSSIRLAWLAFHHKFCSRIEFK